MGETGIEKPMQIIGGKHVVERVVKAMQFAETVDRVLVSVSPNTPKTEAFLKDMGVETIRTSGDDFMMDLHQSFESMSGKYVVTCPSDIPLINAQIIDQAVSAFVPEMQSMIVMVDAEVVRGMGIIPSYTRKVNNKEWVLSGLSVMDREATLRGDYLNEECLYTDWHELAVNVNTPDELSVARRLF